MNKIKIWNTLKLKIKERTEDLKLVITTIIISIIIPYEADLGILGHIWVSYVYTSILYCFYLPITITYIWKKQGKDIWSKKNGT